jgi:hypothetical protein
MQSFKTPAPLALHLTCQECGEDFAFSPRQYVHLGLPEWPKRCPACLDRAQGRPDITLAREELFRACVRIDSLPAGEWVKSTAMPVADGERQPWRLTVKGSRYGADWNGRIDLFSHLPVPPEPGNFVTLVAMRVTKRVAKRAWARQTLEHGTVYGERQVPLAEDGQGVRQVEEVRTYVRLDPPMPGGSGGRQLVWAEARTKTTIKGLGRQYHAELGGDPIWFHEVRGGYRSGRAHTTARLAVVSAERPMLRLHREGETVEETSFPAVEPREQLHIERPRRRSTGLAQTEIEAANTATEGAPDAPEEPLADWERELLEGQQ